MKVVETIITVVSWVVGIVFLVFLGWCLKGYQVRKGEK